MYWFKNTKRSQAEHMERKYPHFDTYQNSRKFKDKDKIIKNSLRQKTIYFQIIQVRLTATIETRKQ